MIESLGLVRWASLEFLLKLFDQEISFVHRLLDCISLLLFFDSLQLKDFVHLESCDADLSGWARFDSIAFGQFLVLETALFLYKWLLDGCSVVPRTNKDAWKAVGCHDAALGELGLASFGLSGSDSYFLVVLVSVDVRHVCLVCVILSFVFNY